MEKWFDRLQGHRRWPWGAVLLAVLACGYPVRADEVAVPAQVLNVAPAAFVPTNDRVRYSIEEGGLGRLCALKGAGYFAAPLSLASGVVIERISAVVQDKNTEGLALISLARRTPEEVQVLAISPISTGTQDVETLSVESISTPVVDAQTYTYLLQVVLTGPGVCLRGAQVQYRRP